jgi:hypothetical protein
MKIKELLKSDDGEGGVRWCDIRTVFGENLTYKQIDELYELFKEIKKEIK